MGKKMHGMIMACATMMVCLILVVVGTFALFSDNATIHGHLEAGNLEITLKRTKLESHKLSETGYFETVTNDKVVDFTNPSEDNIFDLGENDFVVPGSYYEATLEISNLSTVAFEYWLEIVISEGADTELAKQLEIEVKANDKTATATAKDGLVVGSKAEPISSVGVNEKQTFTVKVSFNDLDANNDAQNQKIKFDLLVSGVQVV